MGDKHINRVLRTLHMQSKHLTPLLILYVLYINSKYFTAVFYQGTYGTEADRC